MRPFLSIVTAGAMLVSCSDSDSPDTPKVRHAVSLNVTGMGTGQVTSSPAGIGPCAKAAGTCTAEFEQGSKVTLTAAPDAGYFFAGWAGGGCAGVAACVLDLKAATQVRATFIPVVFNSRKPVAPLTPSAPNIWTARWDLPAEARPLSRHAAGFTFGGSWSPDGERVAYVATVNPADPNAAAGYKIRVAGAGVEPTVVTRLAEPKSYEPYWTPDGRVVFRSSAGLDGTDTSESVENLWVANEDGSDHMPITRFASGVGVDRFYSVNAEFAFFSSIRGLGEDATLNQVPGNIWRVALTTGEQFPLTRSSIARSSVPEVSPDGQRVAFVSQMLPNGAPTSSENLWVVNVDGTNARRLTTFAANAMNDDWRPRWTPDGSRVLITLTVDPANFDVQSAVSNVFSVDVASGAVTPLTRLAKARSGYPWVAPDGSRVVFDSSRALDGSDAAGNTHNVWSMKLDGSDPRPVTQNDDASSYSVDDYD